MLKVLKVPANIDEAPERVEIDGSLESMQALVGGYIEFVTVEEGLTGPGRVMVANEEGLIHGLPFNVRATALGAYGQPIVGDVFIANDGPDGLESID